MATANRVFGKGSNYVAWTIGEPPRDPVGPVTAHQREGGSRLMTLSDDSEEQQCTLQEQVLMTVLSVSCKKGSTSKSFLGRALSQPALSDTGEPARDFPLFAAVPW